MIKDGQMINLPSGLSWLDKNAGFLSHVSHDIEGTNPAFLSPYYDDINYHEVVLMSMISFMINYQ
ncbi:MAG: hypothetical protein MUO63_15175 [Desulfobulbaceae bacterium]|nr:hypothetical protein [Desulfobulbaceae bacterium]